jgi:hypothetical protein
MRDFSQRKFQDLERAVSIAQAAVNNRADWEPYSEISHGDAAEILLTMFYQTQQTQCLDEALAYADIASTEMRRRAIGWQTTYLPTEISYSPNPDFPGQRPTKYANVAYQPFCAHGKIKVAILRPA